MNAPEIVLSILSSVIVALVLYLIKDWKAQQQRFEERISRNVHLLRDDLQYLQVQIAILKTTLASKTPADLVKHMAEIEDHWTLKRQKIEEARLSGREG